MYISSARGARGALGIGFLGMGIFYFWLEQKISGVGNRGFGNQKKSRVKNPQTRGWEFGIFEIFFWGYLGFFEDFSIPGFRGQIHENSGNGNTFSYSLI